MRRVITAWLLALCAWSAAEAHLVVLRFNLEEMIVTADRIFIGRCVAIESASEMIAQGQLPVTRYTFDIEQALKGDVPARIAWTQLGMPPQPTRKGEPVSHGQAVRPGLMLHGTTTFGVGDRMLLFLTPDYHNGRLAYPVGLDQGAFMLDDDDGGQTVVRNALNNLGLFTAPFNGTRLARGSGRVLRPEDRMVAAGVPLSPAARALTAKHGALPLAPFVELIQQIHAAHGGSPGAVRKQLGGQP